MDSILNIDIKKNGDVEIDEQELEPDEPDREHPPEEEPNGETLKTNEVKQSAKPSELSKARAMHSRVIELRRMRAGRHTIASPVSSEMSSAPGSNRRKTKATTVESNSPETGETTVEAKPAMRMSSSIGRSTGQYAAQAAAELKRMLDDGVGVGEANDFHVKTARLQAFMDDEKYKPHHRTARKYEELLEQANKWLKSTTPRAEEKLRFDSQQFFKHMHEAQAELRAAMQQTSEARDAAAKALSDASAEAKQVKSAIIQATSVVAETISAAKEKEKLAPGGQTRSIATPHTLLCQA